MIEEALRALKDNCKISASEVKYACAVDGGIYFVIYNHMQPILFRNGRCVGLNANNEKDSTIMREAEKKIMSGDVI